MSNKVKPLTPDDVASKKEGTIPDAVLECFNRLIAEKWDGHRAVVLLDDVVNALVALGYSRAVIFTKRWLDVEDIYRAAGWRVEFDNPGYCETYPATFTFSRRPAR